MSTYSDASLIYYPSGYKASKAYSLKPTDGSGDLTFTRASTATRVNESGLIESVATGVPRIDYTGGGCGKLLLEPQRTNSILYSQEIDNAYWTKVNLAVSANVISSLDPSGLNTAELITATSGVSQSEVSRSVTTINATPYVFSFFGKKGSGATDLNSFRVLGSGVLNTVTINWDTGAITQSGSGATSVNMGNGWFRIIIPFTANSVTTVLQLVSFQVYPLNVSSLRWGAQLEAGSYPTSPIITTTTAVTRVEDNYVVNNVYTNNLITASGGTWFVHIIDNTIKRRGTGGQGIALSNTSTAAATTNGFKIANASGTPNRLYISRILSGSSVDYLTTTDTLKIGVTWNGTTANVWVNGVKVINSTSFTFTAMDYLTAQNGDVQKIIQSQMLFPTPLSDSDIIALTTI